MNNELQHYGVKGMKWGVRRNPVNKSYSAKQRKQDRAFYGKGGESRINKKLNEGHGLRGARHYEAERKERSEKFKKKAKRGAKAVGGTLAKIGMAFVVDQTFFGGVGSHACSEAIKTVGRATVTAVKMAGGAYDIKWYDKDGNRVG